MSFKKDFVQLLKPYYLFNIFLSLSYVVLKKVPGVCNYLFQDQCDFEGRETEILFFLLIVVMIRTRKAGSVTMINYISASFIYTKVANLILWYFADVTLGMVYGVVFILGAFLLPEPTYSGPDNVIYFRGLQNLEEELKNKQVNAWLITFYTVWNPSCIHFAPVFAKLSNDYTLDNLKFGKIDIGRYPEVAKKFCINDSSLSKQLPSIVLFVDGKESLRRPGVDSKNNIVKFAFSEDNIKLTFGLNNIYQEAKKSTQILKGGKNVKNNHAKKD